MSNHELIIGDFSSGKTTSAIESALQAVKKNGAGSLLFVAPTERAYWKLLSIFSEHLDSIGGYTRLSEILQTPRRIIETATAQTIPLSDYDDESISESAIKKVAKFYAPIKKIIVDDAEDLSEKEVLLLNAFGEGVKIELYANSALLNTAPIASLVNSKDLKKQVLDATFSAPKSSATSRVFTSFLDQISYISNCVLRAKLHNYASFSDTAIIAYNRSSLKLASYLLNANNIPTSMRTFSGTISIIDNLITKRIIEVVKMGDEMELFQLNDNENALHNAIYKIASDCNEIDKWQDAVINPAISTSEKRIYSENIDIIMGFLDYVKDWEAIYRAKHIKQKLIDEDEMLREFMHFATAPETSTFTARSRERRTDSLALLTAKSAKGSHFETVFAININDSEWDNESGDVKNRALFDMLTSRALKNLHVLALNNGETLPSKYYDEFDTPDYTAKDGEFYKNTAKPAEFSAINPYSLRAHAINLRNRAVLHGKNADVVKEFQMIDALSAKIGEFEICDTKNWVGVIEQAGETSIYGNKDQVRLSPSKVETFIKCGLKYALESVGGNIGDTYASKFGTMMHKVAERAALEGKEQYPGSIRAIFEEEYAKTAFQTSIDQHIAKFQGINATESLIGYFKSNKTKVLVYNGDEQVELSLSYVNDKMLFTLSGKVDRIETNGDELVIVDFKTGKEPSRKKAVFITQLAVYKYMLANIPNLFDNRFKTQQSSAKLVFLNKKVTKSGDKIIRVDEDGEPILPKNYEQIEVVPLDKLNENVAVSSYCDLLLTDAEIQAREVNVLDLIVRILCDARVELSSDKLRVSENDDCKYCQMKIMCPIFTESKQVIG
ncbi:MAG: PD-(D/E)XK nuclease family protein [Bifidobacteriaceae bacterium]|jgi:hypothetical protein|nr:PD-(D/E)XK nuclease family protein [Bifidobacteriaceae bacterium]